MRTEIPGEFRQISKADDAEEDEEVKALSDVITRHLKQVVAFEFLEDAAFKFDELQ